MSVVLIQKIDILLYQMKNKVRPLRKSSDAPISDTSRNELKQKQMGSHSMQSNQFSLSNLRLRFFINRLIKKIKFLAPPNRKPDNVKEQWQKMLEQMQSSKRLKQLQIFKKQTLSQQITSRNTIIPVIQFFHAILIVVFSWAVTTSLIFKIHLFISVYVMLAIVNILELGLKISIIWSEQNQQTTYQVYWREDFIQPLYLFFAALLMIVRDFFTNPYFQTFLIIFQFVCVFIQWKNIGKYFSFLTLYAQQNKKRKQLRIIQLFCFTLVMAHIFALVMYSMAYYTPEGQKNWIQKAGLVGKPWYVLYIYTYYWANTTMVTVGYGDLTPSNYFEAIIITLIQIVGTAIFGYMINVIGITVNEIQKKNVEFEQYQSTIFKLKDHYQLSRELCYKMKSDIKKKEFEMKQTPLKNNEQIQFLQYVDPTLKEQFVLQTNMKVIKKSIFFLTHFTVNCQNQIALKLIRCIYKPDELINFQENGQKQMVIINSGKVNVFYKKIHHNQDIAKVVRVIKPSEEKPALNVYGYSSLILNRNINLKAVTQQTTTAYILKRSDIIDSIGKNILDFQSFNELRQRMLQYAYPQEIQAPALIQQENHFIPNIFLLIKKIKNSSQSRLKTTRNKRKQRMKVITIKHYQNKTLLLIPNQRKPQQDDFQLNFLNQVQDIDKLARKDTPRHNPNSKIILLEQGKDFVNFLKNYNLSVIAEQYEKACLRKSYFKRRIEGWSFRSKKTNNPYAF